MEPAASATNRTTFTVVRDEATATDWPDNTTLKVSTITGELAEQIRARTGLTGVVQLTETGTEGGWSEWTAEWLYDITVTVDGQTVWTSESHTPMGIGGTPLAHLLRWVGQVHG